MSKTLSDLIQSSKIGSQMSEEIFEEIAGISKKDIFLQKDEFIVSKVIERKYLEIEKKILAGVPLQYALSYANFFGMRFSVTEGVLIPRPETEVMVSKAIKLINSRSSLNKKSCEKLRVVDIGTGSGCIAISLAAEIEEIKNKDFEIKIFASDISPDALLVAKNNAKLHHAKIHFILSDLLENQDLPESFDLVLANLPYLRPDYLENNISLKYEPDIALNGGANGLVIIDRLIDTLKTKLNDNGIAILEIDPGQAEAIAEKLKTKSLSFSFIKDLNSRTRFVQIENN